MDHSPFQKILMLRLEADIVRDYMKRQVSFERATEKNKQTLKKLFMQKHNLCLSTNRYQK